MSTTSQRDISDAYLQRLAQAADLKIAAQQLEAPPQYEAGNPVPVRGEDLSQPIYWQGRQWAVTPFGLECRDGTYVIARDRHEDRYGWVRHMAGKTWTDLPDFAEALRIARRREQLRPRRPARKRIKIKGIGVG
jgi:hypothetical protein